VRQTLICLLLIVSAAACETSTDPFIGFEGTGGLSQTQAAGNWTFTVHPGTPVFCSPGSLADGTQLTAHLDVLAGGSVPAATSFWQNPPATVIRPLSGAVTLTTGDALLLMSAAAGSGSAMELQGRLTASGSFTGTLRDPSPGSSAVFSTCTYTATGNKTS
jgi:hypothetical protein